MPELPEVEITARRLDTALRGAEVASALAPGINALKTFDPPLDTLAGRAVAGVRRRGKHLVVDVTGDLSLLLHLMSAGRLQLFDKQAGPRDRTSRLLVRLTDGRELRLREFGTRQAAWVKLLPTAAVEEDAAIASLGPEAWPDPPPLRELLAPGGIVLVADERMGDTLGENLTPLGHLNYNWSVLHCLPQARVDPDSAATGCGMGAALLQQYASESGFNRFEILPIDHASWRFYQLGKSGAVL